MYIDNVAYIYINNFPMYIDNVAYIYKQLPYVHR